MKLSSAVIRRHISNTFLLLVPSSFSPRDCTIARGIVSRLTGYYISTIKGLNFSHPIVDQTAVTSEKGGNLIFRYELIKYAIKRVNP